MCICICTSYPLSSLLIHAFSSLLQGARHSVERTLEFDAHEEPDHVRQQAPKILPRLVYNLLVTRPAIPQDLPAFCVDQPARRRCEAPDEPEACVIYIRQDLLRRGCFSSGVIHGGWYMA